MNGTDRLLAAIRSLAAGDADARDHALVEEAHPADIAAALRELPLVEQVAVFRGLAQERAGEVLSELDDDALLQLVRALDEVEVSRILDEMPPKHAADVVEELSTEQAEKILDLMQEEKSEEIQEILEYPEHSAGRLMSPDFVAVNEVGDGRSRRSITSGSPPPRSAHSTSTWSTITAISSGSCHCAGC